MMPLSVTLVLVLLALLLTLTAALGKAPIWVAVLLMVVVQLLTFLPAR